MLRKGQQAAPALKDVAAYLEQRIPGPDVTPDDRTQLAAAFAGARRALAKKQPDVQKFQALHALRD